MPDRTDITTGFLDDGWVHPPTPGTPSHRLIDAAARLMAQSDAEVETAARATEVPLSAEGKWAHAVAAELIERSQR